MSIVKSFFNSDIMRNNQLNTLLFALCLILSLAKLNAQVTNDNRFNLFVEWVGTSYALDDQNGTNYITFLADAAVDTDNKATWLHNTTTGAGYSHSVQWDYDTPETREDGKFYRALLDQQNTSSQHYDISFMAFQNNCGNRLVFDECCGFLCLGGNDVGRLNYYYWWNTRYENEVGQLYYRWIGDVNNARIRLRHAWRFHNGDSFGKPLTFGSLPNNEWRTHTNYNRRNASGAPSHLGYLNAWTTGQNAAFSDAPDVTYKFELSETRFVTATTNYSQTNFDTRLHIAKQTSPTEWELLSSNSDLSSSNVKSSIQQLLDPGTYYVIVEGENSTAAGKFVLGLYSAGAELSAGEIFHPEPWVKQGCNLTKEIINSVPASSPVPYTYSWQQRPEGGTEWTVIAGANEENLTANNIANFTQNTEFRRRITTVGIERFSNIVKIQVVPLSAANGRIQGTVQGRDGIGVVPGVDVFAVSDPPVHGDCLSHFYKSTTNANGQFDISDIYYGVDSANTQYKLYAVFQDHKFKPDTLYLPGKMKSSTRSFTNQIIEDTTVIFLNGSIIQADISSIANTSCPMEGVNFYLKKDSGPELFQTEITDENGLFGVPLLSVGNYALRPELKLHPDSLSHLFSPVEANFTNVVSDVNNIFFEDLQRHTISGALYSCGNYRFGGLRLLFEDDPGCFKFVVDMDASGNFSKEVPAREYRVSVLDADLGTLEEENGYRLENLLLYFNQAIIVDASHQDVFIDFFYRQEPAIEVVGLDASSCGAIVLEQGESKLLSFFVTETNTDGCPMDTGILVIVDEVSEREIMELPISQGVVRYKIMPGDPNFFPPFTKNLTVEARHLDRPEIRSTRSIDIIIEGFKQRESTFTTVSPELPFIILRDPPGDQSYAYIQEATTTEMAAEFFIKSGGSISVWNKAKVGAKFEAGFLGFSTESHFWGEIEGETSVTATNTSLTETLLSFTTGSRFGTSTLEELSAIGSLGDLYVGAAMNLIYAKADVLNFDETQCAPEIDIELIMGNADLETQFVYSEYSLVNSIIPSLEDLRDLQTDDAERDYYQNQINLWNQTISENHRLKEIAQRHSSFPSNISWSGGGAQQEYFSEARSSSRLFLEFGVEIDRTIAAELGFEVGGVGRSGGVIINTRLELGGSATTSTTQSRRVGFVLQDNDNLDRFNTIVKECPVYGTPIFEDVSAITSCPYMPGTSAIDGPQLNIVGSSILSNVNPASAAVFTLRLTNASPDQKTRSYLIDLISSQGALITTDGLGTFPIEVNNLGYGNSKEVQIGVSRGFDPSLFAFEGVSFIAYPKTCADFSEEVTDKVSVSAYFSSTCPSITMASPADGWLNNSDDDNVQIVHLSNYDVAALTEVIVQYSKKGDNAWQIALSVPSSALNPNSTAGSFVEWDIAHVPDGEYELRLRIACVSSTIFTPRVSGTIDRSAPVVFGIPSPIDDIYDQAMNDVISVSFDEKLNCAAATASLIDLETNEVFDVQLSCFDNTAVVTPSLVLESRGPAAYRIQIMGIKDLHGNQRDVYSWVFLVGDYIYDPGCSPVMISNNNENQNAISQSIYRAISINSNGSIINGTNVGYKAEEEIGLLAGFTVNHGGILEASIENCAND